MIQPMSVSGFERDAAGVRVALADGPSLRAPLLIGADGRRSFVREAAGIRTIGWQYPVTAIVATIAHENADERGARIFSARRAVCHFAIEGRAREHRVGRAARAAAEALLAMSEEDFLAELRLRFGDFRPAFFGRPALWLSAFDAIG